MKASWRQGPAWAAHDTHPIPPLGLPQKSEWGGAGPAAGSALTKVTSDARVQWRAGPGHGFWGAVSCQLSLSNHS